MDFSVYPSVSRKRNYHDLKHSVTTSFNVGELIPVDFQEVLPGDTFKDKATVVARVTSSFVKPVMDNLELEMHSFFVPLRLCYDDAELIFGDSAPSAYVKQELATMPTLPAFTNDDTAVDGRYTIANYLGIPHGNMPEGISVAPFRAFALIYNQWFRNENVMDETYVHTGELHAEERVNKNPWSVNNYMGLCPFVNKKKDYFTACHPAPQKGSGINIPVTIDDLPVTTRDYDVPDDFIGKDKDHALRFGAMSVGVDPKYDKIVNIAGGTVPSGLVYAPSVGLRSYGNFGDLTNNYYTHMQPINLFASTGDGASTTVSVNDLRYGFALQKMLERDALYGTRYREYLQGHFGVKAMDSRVQVPEYLGGGRVPIQIQQVAQTSSTVDTEDMLSPLANVAGYSLSNGYAKYTKSFVEHGYVFTVAFLRYKHKYQQGLDKVFFRKRREDFYDPLFAHISEQPVYTAQLYAPDQASLTANVFGYNEAWSEYRFKFDRTSGGMRSDSGSGLDVWHFGDEYSAAPVLNPAFIAENYSTVDRTLSVTHNLASQFILDFYFETKRWSVVASRSIPGLLDH